MLDIKIIKEKISPVLDHYGIEKASVFGSVSRGDDTDNSDVDILVKLGKPMGMFDYMAMTRSIEDSIGRSVDIVTEDALNRHVRPYILSDLKTIYER